MLAQYEFAKVFVSSHEDRVRLMALQQNGIIVDPGGEICNKQDFMTVRAEPVNNLSIDAFVRALHGADLPPFEVASYAEHSLGSGAEARAVSYIQIKTARGHAHFGAGTDTNIELASIKAVVSAVNRSLART